MTTKDWAIRAAGLGKAYQVYAKPHQRLLQSLFRGRRNFYREFWALRNLSFECARGETLGIVGRNGSGKSTLLQLVAGTSFASEGSVAVQGRVAALLELGSGFNPEFTGRENVYLNSAVLGRTRRQTDDMFDAIAHFADIGDFIEQPISTYSSGMTMRLAFAVAIHSAPDILIIDEALAVGDTAFQSKCLARIRALQAAGVAIMFVSHSPNAVLEFCDRAAYLVNGELRAIGACRDVLEQYANDQVQREGGNVEAIGARMQVDVAVPADPAAAAAAPEIEITSVAITDAAGVPSQAFRHGDVVVVEAQVHYASDCAEPCFGIQVRTTDDIALWATTTQYQRLALPPMRAGATLRYEWRLQANVGGNRFVVGLGAGSLVDGEYRRAHRLHYAGHFDVLPEVAQGTGWLALRAAFAMGDAVGSGAALPAARRPRVLLGGWYGAVNVGDELLLETLAGWVREAGGEPCAISVNPGYTRATLGIDAVAFDDDAAIIDAMARADLFVLGGGGLLQDYDPLDAAALTQFPAPGATRYAQWLHLAADLGVPTLALAQGVGPLRSDSARMVARDLFSRVDAATLRDAPSQDLLAAVGVGRDFSVAADPVWASAGTGARIALDQRYPQLAGRRLLAVNVRAWPFTPGWDDAFVEAFDGALPPGWATLWIDFARTPATARAGFAEAEIAPSLIARLAAADVHVVFEPADARDAAAALASCDAVLAMRLHAVLIGHRAGLPVLSIEYDDKVAALNASLGVPSSQRLALGEIGSRLRAAVAELTTQHPAAARVAAVTAQSRASDALVHRHALWNAMAHPLPRHAPAHPLAGQVLAALVAARPELTAAVAGARAAHGGSAITAPGPRLPPAQP